MRFQSLPRAGHAGWSPLQGALSTNTSLLRIEAFGLVPPLHDDSGPILTWSIASPFRVQAGRRWYTCSPGWATAR